MEACEKVQRSFLRVLLGVRAGTPKAALLGEAGRFEATHTAVTLIGRFWNRLVDMPDTVNGSDARKVREWLQIRGPLAFGAYEPAVYLQAVASRTGRVRLAQFRTGSHWLRVETGRWVRLPR